MADYTYEDYRHALISTGEAKLMDLSYNWDRKLFDRKMNQQLFNDMSLKGDKIFPIMVLANSYMEANIFLGLMKHPNLDKESIAGLDFMNNLNGPLIRKQYYISIFRNDLWVNDHQLEKAWSQIDASIDIAFLLNERAVMKAKDIAEDILLRHDASGDDTDKDRVIKVVSENDYLQEIAVMFFNKTGSDTYLPDSAKDIFLF